MPARWFCWLVALVSVCINLLISIRVLTVLWFPMKINCSQHSWNAYRLGGLSVLINFPRQAFYMFFGCMGWLNLKMSLYCPSNNGSLQKKYYLVIDLSKKKLKEILLKREKNCTFLWKQSSGYRSKLERSLPKHAINSEVNITRESKQ